MTNHGVLIQNMVAAMDVSAYNRSVISSASTVDIENGNVFLLNAKSTTSGEAEVWVAAKGTGSSTGFWMAYSPEIVTITSNGKEYRGLSPDPRDFTNIGGYPFDAFKLQAGDIITITADGTSGSPSTGAYVNPTDNTFVLTWAASQGSYASFKLIKETYISIGSGAMDTQRVLAYQLQCLVA
jgi:hypothetical protein